MLSFLPGRVLGTISFMLLILNTILWALTIYPLAILKFVIPNETWREKCNYLLIIFANCWISCNNANLRLTKKIHWDVEGIEKLKNKDWYLVLANHQTWVDILVLQRIFHHKIPYIKFFLKKELIWVPIMGLAWWALEFPFMKRYTQEFLEKHPNLKGKDMEITKKACMKFKKIPISVMNFVEGTRFTIEKHKRQQSPFAHLLKPKAGGISFVLSAMGEQFRNILNVTIMYPDGAISFWEFLCSKSIEIVVRVECIPITKDLLGDYINDHKFREYFQDWLNTLWIQKDQHIKELYRSKNSHNDSEHSIN